jgi:quinol monooxygenase YgiN
MPEEEEVVVVVRLAAQEDRIGDLRRLMADSAERTHGEPGCLTYALHQANEDPAILVLVERWAGQTALDRHLAQPEMAKLFSDLEDVLVAAPQVTFCHALAIGVQAKATLAGT